VVVVGYSSPFFGSKDVLANNSAEEESVAVIAMDSSFQVLAFMADRC
jgi:hypothetical protein